MTPVLIVLAVLLCIPLFYMMVTYNALVAIRNHIRDAWANIDTELKRRSSGSGCLSSKRAILTCGQWKI